MKILQYSGTTIYVKVTWTQEWGNEDELTIIKFEELHLLRGAYGKLIH